MMSALPVTNQEHKTPDQRRERGIGDPGISYRGVELPAFSLIELWPAEHKFVLRLVSGKVVSEPWSEKKSEGFGPIPTRDELPPGDYICFIIGPGRFQIINKITIQFATPNLLPDEVQKAFNNPKKEIVCKVVWNVATDVASGEKQEKQKGTSNTVLHFPVKGNIDILRTHARLRAFVWELLNHFANAPNKPLAQARYEDIQAQIAKDPNASEIVARTIQAWNEFQRTRSKNDVVFERLTEVLIEQWTFGNATVRYNRLALRDEPEGWGLYHRGNGIKYYNEFGMPVESFMGTRWEKHYRMSKPGFQLPINVSPDDPMFSILELYRAGGVPDPDLINAAARGYIRSSELLVEEIKKNPGKWQNVMKHFREQTWFLVTFLFLEGLATFLETVGGAQKLVGKAIKLSLKGIAYYFSIRFTLDATRALLEIGVLLYRVKRGKDGKPDRLSKRHLAEAADLAREQLEVLAAMIAILAAGQTAKVISNVIQPKGSSGPRLQFAPNRAGAHGIGAVAVPAAEAAGGLRIPPGLVLMSASEWNRKHSKKKQQKKTEHKKVDPKLQEEVELARREAEKEWQDLEKELKDFLKNEVKAPDELRYSGRQAKTVFEDLFKELEARTKSEGELARVRAARDRYDKLRNNEKTQKIDNLLDNVGLKHAYLKYEKYVELQKARAQDDLRRASWDKREYPDEYRLAREEVGHQNTLSNKLKQFREGLNAERFFDGVQVFVERQRVVITDTTMRVREPFHMMKSIVYREIFQSIFPDFKVEVWEYRSPTAFYEIRPTAEFAIELERTIDLKQAQENP